MLEFFRKYQRYFFIVIAIVIVISFSFFGTHQTLTASKQVEDYPIGKAVDGSQMRKQEIDEISRFLWSDRMDLQLAEKRIMPNFFNDGVIRKDLLSTGLGVMLADQYFDLFRESFAQKVTKHKQFHPYTHPTAHFISFENLWGQVLPLQKEKFDQFLHQDLPVNTELFSLLVDLYLGETAFPPNILREYLMFQEKHYEWMQPDPALPQTNLSLFHCASIEDWFGPDFVQLAAQFVHNASLIAKEKGYKVSKEEARVDLFRNGFEALQTQKRSQEVDQTELGGLWKEQLLHLQMTDKAAIAVWQKVMLMRRLFEDYGHAALLDSHQYQSFHSYASKTAIVDLYELPASLHLTDFQGLLRLAFYCDAVSQGGRKGNALPEQFGRIETLAKKYPDLVQKRFLVEVAEVNKKALAQNVSLKDMWEWQLEEANFEALKKDFPDLAVFQADDDESRFAALEKLHYSVRNKLDHDSRMQIVGQNPEWIDEAFDNQHLRTREIAISPIGKVTGLDCVENGLELMQLLEKASLKGEMASDPIALQAKNDLSVYSGDEQTYYRIHVLERDTQQSVLTFKEANERGVLRELLATHLEKHYPKVRQENPTLFQTQDGEWKPFHDVQDQVGKEVYRDVLQAIDQDYVAMGGELDQTRLEDLSSFYPRYALYHYMKKAQQNIRQEGNQSRFLAPVAASAEDLKLAARLPLSAQWGLVKETKTCKNYEKAPWFNESLFAMVEKSWSSVQVLADGSLKFFQLQEKAVPEETYLKEIKQGREILSVEAQRFLMTEILESLQEKEAIHLTTNQDVK